MVPLEILLLIILLFLISIFIGLPVPLAILFGAGLFLPFIGRDFSLTVIAQKLLSTFDKDPLFAILFFVAMGNFLLESRLSDVIVDFVDSLFGKMRGGLAVINIWGSTLFGGLTGAVVSDIAAVGGITIPAMKKRGYGGAFSTAVATAAGINGSMIPPSINGLTYAIVNEMSVADVFFATAVPGVLYAILLSIGAVLISRKRGYKASEESFSVFRSGRLFFRTLPAMSIPLLLIILIYCGIATPTESGALAVFAAIMLGAFGYRTLKMDGFKRALVSTCISTGTIMFLVASSFVLSYSFSMSGLTKGITDVFWAFSDSPNLLIFIVMVVVLALGMILDAQAIIIIFSPIVLEIFRPLGVDPLHLSGIYVFACLIGLMIPPVASALVMGCAVGNEPLSAVVKELLPFLGIAIFTLFICAYIPGLVVWLPRLLGYHG
jgi:C4-dicarboxylate transporter DctM subunit